MGAGSGGRLGTLGDLGHRGVGLVVDGTDVQMFRRTFGWMEILMSTSGLLPKNVKSSAVSCAPLLIFDSY